MAVTLCCPCGHRFSVAKVPAGRPARCPVCNQATSVPESVDDRASTDLAEWQPPPVVRAAIDGAEAEPPPRSGPPPLPEGRPAARRSGRKGRRRVWAKRRRSSPKTPETRPVQVETRIAIPAPPPVPGQPVAIEAKRPPRRRAFRRSRRTGPATLADVYRADPGKIQTVRWLSLLLALIVAFNAAPALEHLDLEAAPGWARVVLLLAALEAFYVLWMLVTPDWASVRVVTVVFVLVAALYAAATVVALVTPPDQPLPLGSGELRHAAPHWCASVVLVSLLAAYLCGRAGAKWRRAFKLETAARP